MARKSNSVDGPDIDDLDGQHVNIGTENGNAGTINPATIGNGGSFDGDDARFARDADGNIIRNADGSPRKKRGRKPGGGRSPVARQANDTKNLKSAVETLSMAIGGLHLAIAGFTKSPEMQLDDTESKALSESIVNVMDQFDMSPDPRIVAVGGLIATASTIYGPRMYMIRERRKEEKNKNSPNDKSAIIESFGEMSPNNPNVYDFTGTMSKN